MEWIKFSELNPLMALKMAPTRQNEWLRGKSGRGSGSIFL